jgi:hypothetical protein
LLEDEAKQVGLAKGDNGESSRSIAIFGNPEALRKK